jgi:predicted DsbA family dithiol-disulfide isomerase
MSKPPPIIEIDIISDVVCPWCFLGKRALDVAMSQRLSWPMAVRFRPFVLDPTIPHEGVDRAERMARIFAGREDQLAASRKALEEQAASLGITLALDKATRQPNTRVLHKMIRWARSENLEVAMAETLFQAFFCEGEDLTDIETLMAITRGLGLDDGLMRRLIEDGADDDALDTELEMASRMGVSSVPCFIFNRSWAVMGAQPPKQFLMALDRARAEVTGRA